jgi:hypothetical protein
MRVLEVGFLSLCLSVDLPHDNFQKNAKNGPGSGVGLAFESPYC